jgi:polar amino acid transport system substrate-binding protein
MKRIALVTALAAVATGVFAAWSLAQPTGRTGGTAEAAQLQAAKFPPLPADVKSRKRWIIGVKCDSPPFGYIDVRGRNAGYDVEVAQRFAELAFGKKSRVSYTCVTTPSRIPALQAGRVDIIISTLTWTKARTEQIDYSIPYYGAAGRLLVPKSGSVKTLSDLNGKTIVTTRGSIYATWTRNCVKSAKLLEVDGTAAAVLAVKNGQADTFMYDDAFVLGVATTDRDLELTKDKFLDIPWGIGIRKGDTVTANWVNAGIRLMKKRDEFWKILQRNAPKSAVATFADQVPRPKNNLQYPLDKTPESDCSARG